MRRTIIWMSRKIEFDLRNDFFSHLLKLDPTFYHKARTGDIMARATNDVEAVRMMIGPGIMHIGNAIVVTIIAVSFMLYLSPKLTLYSLLPLPVLSIVVNRLGGAVFRRIGRTGSELLVVLLGAAVSHSPVDGRRQTMGGRD